MAKIYLPKNRKEDVLSLIEKYNLKKTNMDGHFYGGGTNIFLRTFLSGKLEVEYHTKNIDFEKDILGFK